MDVDPPVPPSSASKKISKSGKKPKFTPKPPVTRRRALILPKSDSSDADSESDQEFLRQFIGRRLRSGVSKVEKKSSDNAAASVGAGSSRTNDPPKKEKDGNNKNSSNLKEISAKSVMFSSSTATKDEDVPHMLVDDSGSSSDSENEYKEPWDPHSYYPISLPLRPPGSGNPEVLNAEEFGKQDDYEETEVNSALELGLLGSVDDDEKRMILFRFPDQLPLDRAPVSLKGKEKAMSSSSLKEDASNKRSDLKDLPNGCMGKMLVYKSGAIKLKLGDTIFDVSSGTPRGFDRSVAMMNTKSKDCCVLGKVDKGALVTPDINFILDNINQL